MTTISSATRRELQEIGDLKMMSVDSVAQAKKLDNIYYDLIAKIEAGIITEQEAINFLRAY